jgi:tagatose-6-phosphate ketose/aldose isomerase
VYFRIITQHFVYLFWCCKDSPMQNELTRLSALPEQEKRLRGLSHTPREIYQQPMTWQGTMDRMSASRPVLCDFLEASGIGRVSQNAPGVLLVGAGTSDYIGRAVSRILRREWKCNVTAVPSTELLTNIEDFILTGRKYLMVSFSRSGDSSEGVAVLEQAIERYPNDIHHLLVTCNTSGAMAQLPGITSIVLDDAVNDRGLAMTSSFTNMVIVGQYLANIFAPQRYESLAEEMIDMGSRIIAEGADLASRLAEMRLSRMCFLGSGSLQAAAEESSLKVLELNAGKIATVSQSPLGLRHGPLSFVDRDTLVVAFLSAVQERQSYELDLLEELKQKDLAAETVIIAPRITKRMAALSKNVLSLEGEGSLPDAYRPPIDTIFGQLIGLFTCITNKGTPDTPSTGAINRVVSNVKIYPSSFFHQLGTL